MATPDIVCNEPLRSHVTARSSKVWATMLSADLPGKRVLVEIQLNHGLTEEDKPLLDTKLLNLYSSVTTKFAQLHGENTRSFIVRAPESLELVGLHVLEFGGPSNGIACFETAFCVSERKDSKIKINHVDERFSSTEFDLYEGLPKNRILNWNAHVNAIGSEGWTAAIKNALQYYVNRHKGPTGQIEVPLKGLNIVVGSILPEGDTTHSKTTLATAALISGMTVAGEWGRISLTEFAMWVSEAETGTNGRGSNLGPVVFGMPNEVLHVGWNPARPKGHPLTAGHVFLTAHTGVPNVENVAHGRFRATTTHIGFAYFKQAYLESVIQTECPVAILTSDERVYEVLQHVPERVTRAQVLAQIKDPKQLDSLKNLFKTHPEPKDGYAAREKLLFVLAELQRAERAKGAIRRGDAAELGGLMTLGQVGEASHWHQFSSGGIQEAVYSILHAASDDELNSLSEHGDSLWRQSGCSGASGAETDAICDLADGTPGVLGARWTTAQRVMILCKKEAVSAVQDRLTAGYYQPRGLAVSLLQQVYACRGAGLLDV